MKNVIRRKPYLIPVFIIIGAAAIGLFGWVVMALWNAALVPATSAAIITFWQALGLLVLSRLLVGGFSGGRRHRRGDYWKEKWDNMSEEKKAAIMEKLKNRFEGRNPEQTNESKDSPGN
ncbi:MAG: hypothetical protein HZB42_11480 [Sphingobacteriales bacterium]|nr:hypothetical protein [Sphingobacteriales bacterium]